MWENTNRVRSARANSKRSVEKFGLGYFLGFPIQQSMIALL
jgi:hypothetical protein